MPGARGAAVHARQDGRELRAHVPSRPEDGSAAGGLGRRLMHIVQFQHTRVPVEKYGGAQRVVVWLSQALVELGHEVTLLAGRGSNVPGVRVAEVDAAEVRRAGFDVHQYVRGPVDVMHYHGLVEHPPHVPYVATLHGNLGPSGIAPPYVICLSQDHARRHGTATYVDRKSTRLNSSHPSLSRMPSS